jgi:hypothetical protein
VAADHVKELMVGATAGYLHDGAGHGVWAVKHGADWLTFDTAAHVPWSECVRLAPDGLLLEFGVRGGTSIREIAAATAKQVHGFDWWRGLPHEWDIYSPKGACLAARPVDLPANVTLVDGLFSDTLEGFLGAHREPIGFVNLDCDLFASSYFVLHCLVDRFVTGSVVALSAAALFPTLAQPAAWRRYLRESGQSWEFIGKQHAWGEVWRKS